MWLYGSGFPKSMDISKQIDKRNGRKYEDFKKLGNYIAEKITDTDGECAEKVGFSSALVRFWKLGERIPNKETWLKLKNIYNIDDTFDWLIDREESEREIIGSKKSKDFSKHNGSMMSFTTTDDYKTETKSIDITIPSTDLAKQWQGWGTALKPSFEPIIVARKPFKGSLVDNVIEYGVGGINIDECRVKIQEGDKGGFRNGTYTFNCEATSYKPRKNGEIYKKEQHQGGRFPANTILTYDDTDFDEVCGGFPYGKSGTGAIRKNAKGLFGLGGDGKHNIEYGDSGSASRYFMNCKYTGKDEEIWKQLLVNNVESNLEILKATKDNIAQMNVEDLLKELKDHYAKYVDNQLDLIETPIVQDIVKILTWDFKIETSQVIQDFITNSKKCIQFLNLVQFVEKMGNIDTTQITQNLLKLFGYVKVVITNYIQGNIEYDQKRYIYTPKASKKDRDEGLEDFIEQKVNDGRETPIDNAFQRGETQRKNTHPTVKPTELMQYLVRLVTPKGGKILDPFMGSGSTGKAVMFENKERNAEYKFIGIEKEKEYYEIANARIKWAEEYKEETLDSMQININEILEENKSNENDI